MEDFDVNNREIDVLVATRDMAIRNFYQFLVILDDIKFHELKKCEDNLLNYFLNNDDFSALQDELSVHIMEQFDIIIKFVNETKNTGVLNIDDELSDVGVAILLANPAYLNGINKISLSSQKITDEGLSLITDFLANNEAIKLFVSDGEEMIEAELKEIINKLVTKTKSDVSQKVVSNYAMPSLVTLSCYSISSVKLFELPDQKIMDSELREIINELLTKTECEVHQKVVSDDTMLSPFAFSYYSRDYHSGNCTITKPLELTEKDDKPAISNAVLGEEVENKTPLHDKRPVTSEDKKSVSVPIATTPYVSKLDMPSPLRMTYNPFHGDEYYKERIAAASASSTKNSLSLTTPSPSLMRYNLLPAGNDKYLKITQAQLQVNLSVHQEYNWVDRVQKCSSACALTNDHN